MRRGPRRAGSPDTREAILTAARRRFAESGYDRSTIRAIAGEAGVDPSLVIHYFGTKADLFAEATELPLRSDSFARRIFDDLPGTPGERMARLFFEIWDQPELREPLLGHLRLALSSADPPPIRALVVDMIVGRAGEFIEGPDARLRMELAAAHLVGIAVVRYVIGLEPIATTPVERLISEVAPQLDAYLTPR